MSVHTIGKVIYGYELEVNDNTLSILTYIKNNPAGFLEFAPNKYSYEPRAFGILLDEIDEMSTVDLANVKLIPAEEDKEKLQLMIEALDPEFKNFIKSLNTRTFILWTTNAPDNKTIVRELSEAVYMATYYDELWNSAGSREYYDSKNYYESEVESLIDSYNLSFKFGSEQCEAEYAAREAFRKSRDRTHEDYDPNYEMEDGLRDLLDSLE